MLVLTSVIVFADSKSEIELRAKLAASESARLEAIKEKTALTAALAKLNASATNSGGTAAAVNAASAQITAAANAAVAQKAAEEAALAAAAAKAQADQLKISSDSGYKAVLIGSFFTFMAVIAGIVQNIWLRTRDDRTKLENEERARRWRKEDEDHHTHVLAQIGEVKDEAHAAYKEANTVNLKLETIGVEMRDKLPLAPL